MHKGQIDSRSRRAPRLADLLATEKDGTEKNGRGGTSGTVGGHLTRAGAEDEPRR